MAVDGIIGTALKDPLSEITRRERRFLLATSALAIIVVDGGMLPSQIGALGITFDPTDRRFFYLALGGFVAYFLASFVIYGWADYLSWTLSRQRATLDSMNQVYSAAFERAPHVPSTLIPGVEQSRVDFLKKWHAQEKLFVYWAGLTGRTAVVRAMLDFGVPLVLAGFALWRLTHAWWTFPLSAAT